MVSEMRRGMMSVLVGVALLCAAMLGFAGQAFASAEVGTYNSNCVISAVAKNAVNEDADSSNDIPIAVVAAPEEPGANASAEELAAYEAALAEYDAYQAKVQAAEAGQYIDVTLTFPNGVPSVTAAQAETYLQNNVTIADRHIDSVNQPAYVRDVYDVAVNSGSITFKIGPNSVGTTANYKGTLRIDCQENDLFYSAMGNAKAETLIQSGMALTCSASSNFAMVGVTSGALNRGMVHILFKDGGNILFTGSSTFQNGIITIHAHSFATMTPAEYASAIASAANTAASESGSTYEFVASGSNVMVRNTASGSVSSGISVDVYDGAYLNSNTLAVGDIDEPEMNND